MNFFLEPYIFAIDPAKIDQPTFEKYINTLTEWEEFSKMDWGQIYLLSTTYDCLLNNGYYPFTDNLKILIEQYKINYIGINDVDRILNQFLIKFPTLENEITTPLYEFKGGTSDFDLSNRPDVFNLELLRLSGLLSLEFKDDTVNKNANIIFTKDICGNITFESIFDIMDDDGSIVQRQFVSNYSCFETLYGFCIDITSPEFIWKNANDKKDFEMAIRVSIMQECRYDCISKAVENHDFYLQDSFFECINDLHFQNIDSKVLATLRALKEVVLDLNLAETHWLRINAGANSKQKKHNGYSGWRKDIDYEYHLHYWSKSNEIKFANIFSHNTYVITKES